MVSLQNQTDFFIMIPTIYWCFGPYLDQTYLVQTSCRGSKCMFINVSCLCLPPNFEAHPSVSAMTYTNFKPGQNTQSRHNPAVRVCEIYGWDISVCLFSYYIVSKLKGQCPTKILRELTATNVSSQLFFFFFPASSSGAQVTHCFSMKAVLILQLWWNKGDFKSDDFRTIFASALQICKIKDIFKYMMGRRC